MGVTPIISPQACNHIPNGTIIMGCQLMRIYGCILHDREITL